VARGNTAIGANVAPDTTLTVNKNTIANSFGIGPASVVHLVGADGTNSTINHDGFGGSLFYAARRANGTALTKAVVNAGDQIFNFNANGWNGSAYAAAGAIKFVSGETWNGSQNGGYVVISTTPLGSNVLTDAVKVQPSGGVSIGAAAIAVDPGVGSLNLTGTVNGVTLDNNAWSIYTPTLTAGSGTLTSAVATGQYKRFGKTVHLNVAIIITTNGTGAVSLNVTLPFPAAISSVVPAKEVATTAKAGMGLIAAGSTSASCTITTPHTPEGMVLSSSWAAPISVSEKRARRKTAWSRNASTFHTGRASPISKRLGPQA
jgi:hypothetical protein